MRWRTANNHRSRPRVVCRREGHVRDGGYGFAFGGGLGSYEFCRRCGHFFGKTIDEDAQTFIFGRGVLILPSGEELVVKEMTITMGDRIQLIERGKVVRDEPVPGSPTRIEVRQ